MLCGDDIDGWDWGAGREVLEGGDKCIHIADSLRCTAETNKHCKATILPLKKINK